MLKILPRDLLNELYSKFTTLSLINELIKAFPEETKYICESIKYIFKKTSPLTNTRSDYIIDASDIIRFKNLDTVLHIFDINLTSEYLDDLAKMEKLTSFGLSFFGDPIGTANILKEFLEKLIKYGKESDKMVDIDDVEAKLKNLCFTFWDRKSATMSCAIYDSHYALDLMDFDDENHLPQILDIEKDIDKLIFNNLNIEYLWTFIDFNEKDINSNLIIGNLITDHCGGISVNDMILYHMNFLTYKARGYIIKYMNEPSIDIFKPLTEKISELNLDSNIEVFDMLLYPDENFQKIILKLPKVRRFTILYDPENPPKFPKFKRRIRFKFVSFKPTDKKNIDQFKPCNWFLEAMMEYEDDLLKFGY